MGYLANLEPDTNDSQWDLLYKIARGVRSIFTTGIPVTPTAAVPTQTLWVQDTQITLGAAGAATRMSPNQALYVRYAIIVPASTNADTLTYGPNSNANIFDMAVGLNQEIDGANSTSFRLHDWFVKAPTTAGQKFTVVYQPV